MSSNLTKSYSFELHTDDIVLVAQYISILHQLYCTIICLHITIRFERGSTCMYLLNNTRVMLAPEGYITRYPASF